jgi:hypothetical protein
MPRYGSAGTTQTLTVSVRLADQLVPGTLQHALNQIVDERIDLEEMGRRWFCNDATGPRAYQSTPASHSFPSTQHRAIAVATSYAEEREHRHPSPEGVMRLHGVVPAANRGSSLSSFLSASEGWGVPPPAQKAKSAPSNGLISFPVLTT